MQLKNKFVLGIGPSQGFSAMASELISTYLPRLVEAAKTVTPWQATAGFTAAVVIGAYIWRSTALRNEKRTGVAGAGLFRLTGGGIKKNEVAKYVDGYEGAFSKCF